MSKLNIDDIVSVVVKTTGQATPRDGFNIGLILGKTVGTGMDADNRTLVVSKLSELVDAGYATTSPEYKAAEKYFAQDPAPSKLVVGLCVGTTEDETTTYETWPVAIQACRESNGTWYGLYVADTLTSADIQAIAAYVETINAAFFFEDSESDDITNATTDVFSVLKGLGYRRVFGLYSTSQYAGAAAMGVAMGHNDGTANSAFTMAYKTLVGIATDDLTPAQVAFLQDKHANYYVNRGGRYDVLETGVCSNGTFFDELIGIDQMTNELQLGCMDVLAKSRTKVPYSDAGALQFVDACNVACRAAFDRGFLSPGQWDQPTLLNLENGDTLESGFFCQAEPVANQSAANRANRICPPIYVAVHLAGAIHSVAIVVHVI